MTTDRVAEAMDKAVEHYERLGGSCLPATEAIEELYLLIGAVLNVCAELAKERERPR